MSSTKKSALKTHVQVALALYELNRLYLRIKSQARQCTQLQLQRCGEQTEGTCWNLPVAILALNSINDPVSGNKVQRNRADDSASSSSLTCTCVHITCMQYIQHHTDTLTQTDRQREGAGREGRGGEGGGNGITPPQACSSWVGDGRRTELI